MQYDILTASSALYVYAYFVSPRVLHTTHPSKLPMEPPRPNSAVFVSSSMSVTASNSGVSKILARCRVAGCPCKVACKAPSPFLCLCFSWPVALSCIFVQFSIPFLQIALHSFAKKETSLGPSFPPRQTLPIFTGPQYCPGAELICRSPLNKAQLSCHFCIP